MRRFLPTGLLWPLVLAVTLLLAGLVPLLGDGRYYYSGDSQTAYLGWAYRLGEEVRAGRWPLLDVQSWRAGNAVAEGQWGLFSPLSIALGVLASVSSNVVVYLTAVKVALVVVSGLGVYLLVRSYRVPAAVAVVAGLLAPLSGQSQYGDWPSWSAGLMVTALLPWAWWAIRRMMVQGGNPLPALLSCYLVVTIGYVYGTVYLALVIAGCLLECWLTGNRGALLRVFLVGVVSGLVALTVYLPGILTAPVTIRGAWQIIRDGIWTVDLPTLFSSPLPVGQTDGEPAVNRYVAWVVPLLLWVGWSRLRSQWRELSGLLLVNLILLVWVLGPNQVGPIRWPLRVLPALTLVLVVLLVVLLVRTAPRRPSWGRLALSLCWVVAAWSITTVRLGRIGPGVAIAALMVGVAVLLVWVALRWKGLTLAAAVAAMSTLAMLLAQHVYRPDPPSPDRNMPALAADYRIQLSTAVGDTFMVGNPAEIWAKHPRAAQEMLVGSTWYLNEHPVHNAGTAISYKPYHFRFCMKWSGVTCPDALTMLFRPTARTREPWADLMSVSTVLIAKKRYSAERLADPPDGWHVSDVGRWSVTWVRDNTLPTAGGPSWTSPGTRVGAVSSSDRAVSFRVEDVPAGGGEVVLSRLAWPGYEVDGGRLGRPHGAMLLTVDVPAGSQGSVVSLRYTPPAWRFALGCWWLAVGLSVLWSAQQALARRRRTGPVPSAGSPVR